MNTCAEYNKSRITADWVFTASDRAAIEQGCYFDFDAANRVRKFFTTFLRHSKGPFAGKPFILMTYQWNNIVGPAFGWKMPDGTRRFKEVELWLPKKNGKSTLMAGIAIYMLLADGEAGSEVYSAAADRTQAAIIYNEAVTMVKKSPGLKKALRVKKAVKELHHDHTNSIYKVLASTGFRSDGINIHCLLFDELHTQQNRKLWAALRYGTAGRRQGIKFVTSTAGEDDETLLWYERFAEARKIQASTAIDIHLLACVYALEDGEDWTLESTWKRINPGWEIINAVEFKRDYENSKKSSANEVEFLRYRLNKSTKYQSAWIRHEYWKLGITDGLEIVASGTPIFSGVDLADTIDLNAAIYAQECTHPTKGNCIRIVSQFWTASEAVNYMNGINADRYVQWNQTGFLTMIPGPVASQDHIEDDIVIELGGKVVGCLGIDMYNANRFAYSIEKKLKAYGQEVNVNQVRYNCATMNNAVRFIEELIYTGRIIHDDNPIMNWMFGNIKCVHDSSGNRKLDKSSSQGKKIDGFSALCIAIYCMINVDRKLESRYNTLGTKPISISIAGADNADDTKAGYTKRIT